MKYFRTFIFIIILQFVSNFDLYSSNEVDSTKNYSKYLGLYERKYSIGLDVSVLPRMIAEEEIRQIPFIDFKYRMGAPLNTVLLTNITANYLVNQIGIGLEYSHNFGNFTISVSDLHNFWFGFAQLEGFNNYAEGWINQPRISVGYFFSDIYFEVSEDLSFVTSETYYAGSIESASKKNYLAGSSFAFSFEQPFWKDNQVIIGMKINYNRSNFKYWMAFYTTQDWFLFPEFYFGFLW